MNTLLFYHTTSQVILLILIYNDCFTVEKIKILKNFSVVNYDLFWEWIKISQEEIPDTNNFWLAEFFWKYLWNCHLIFYNIDIIFEYVYLNSKTKFINFSNWGTVKPLREYKAMNFHILFYPESKLLRI